MNTEKVVELGKVSEETQGTGLTSIEGSDLVPGLPG
jgi:hypothetical protein